MQHEEKILSGRREPLNRKRHVHAPLLSLVIPTYNERANIAPLIFAVEDALGDLPWEVIIVDDDSPDGTYDEVNRIAQYDPRVRCVRRIGRRGLSSAVIEGALAANADVVGVMDADFQHDEKKLRLMYEKLLEMNADVVVGTRYAGEGGTGEWSATRAKMSDIATRISIKLIGDQTSDPVSGFFMVRRAVLAATLYNLSQQGYKILIDILSSSPRPLVVAEVPYVFRTRREGESKISLMVLAEFAFLLIEKGTGGLVPPRLILFLLVGGLGLIVHLITLYAGGRLGFSFVPAQVVATGVAMVFNYLVNNSFTYRDRRLIGLRFYTGLILFVGVCSVGAIANIGVADLAIEQTHNWGFAGVAGAILGAFFNFGAASSLVWGSRKPRAAKPSLTTNVE